MSEKKRLSACPALNAKNGNESMQSIAYVGLGSNLNDPVQQVSKALSALQQLPTTKLTAASNFYQTVPVGCSPQPDFINAVACVYTELTPEKLLVQLQLIEHRQGRVRSDKKNMPRTLDLDLLLYGSCVIQSADLVIPHPRLTERAFVLIPLAEIAPEVVIPPTIRLGPLITALSAKELQNVVRIY